MKRRNDQPNGRPHRVGTAAQRAALAMRGVALVAVILAGCGDDQDPAGAHELYQRIESSHYRSWRRAPGYEQRREATSPHSDEVDIYVNDVVARALDDKKPLAGWPVGSIIVKDGFDGSDHELIAVMEKRKDGWFWAESFGGDVKYSGRPELCIDCHTSGDDYVRAFSLPR